MVVHFYNPSYSELGDRRIKSSKPSWAKFMRPYPISQTKYKQMGWDWGSSGGELALACSKSFQNWKTNKQTNLYYIYTRLFLNVKYKEHSSTFVHVTVVFS
jgi:hypothetical protein